MKALALTEGLMQNGVGIIESLQLETLLIF